MDPTPTLAANDDPNEPRERVPRHQHAPAQGNREPDRLELAASGIRETAIACQVLLSELGMYLEVLGKIGDRRLRDAVLTRAEQDVKRLTQAVSHIVARTYRER